jgi:hypothetical protein
MASPHSYKYEFKAPTSIKSAQQRMRDLLIDIMNIEKQLSYSERRGPDGKLLSTQEYKYWRSRTHASLVFKRAEYTDLKAWILNRRREIEASELGIRDPNSPREVLVACRALLRELLDNGVQHEDLGVVYNVVDQTLQHSL